jgi:hypothetical protein
MKPEPDSTPPEAEKEFSLADELEMESAARVVDMGEDEAEAKPEPETARKDSSKK